ncbi:stage III sporulation protein AA [Desulfotomaculum nigrificans CO-1-SRB]|uniref:Stage III sporulation protein AA n=1 Tax=Desulfotomaculum nigrificans (strain DSM 14880 / VKM B-2319 / CO-1-SRB) TaxID=868595 RepID=F6B9Z5_DESCC|nr:stage III sporulation protein AA [Desulfotomaculum nigrificans]AEF94964.1 stage III sporulation protein AA [Desulfotomaculum nigrificans CO-1-SRB]
MSVLDEVLNLLPLNLRQMLSALPAAVKETAEEIRIRQGRPLMLGLAQGDCYITEGGTVTASPGEAYVINSVDVERVTQLVSRSSIYALEEELRNGFITLPGGHRVGITGKVLTEQGRVKNIKYIAGFNFRISRALVGVADKVLPYLISPEGRFYHTMLVSPPRCGKTTLLRDLVRRLSEGVPELGLPGMTVGVVDERSEIAGCYRGVPQRDIGPRTDVLDACPKAAGMMMLLRSMGPQVIATDEIGRPEDIAALEEMVNAGVKVLTTVHGASLEELTDRPALQYLFQIKAIQRFVILGRSKGVGTVEDIIDGRSMRSLGVKKC